MLKPFRKKRVNLIMWILDHGLWCMVCNWSKTRVWSGLDRPVWKIKKLKKWEYVPLNLIVKQWSSFDRNNLLKLVEISHFLNSMDCHAEIFCNILHVRVDACPSIVPWNCSLYKSHQKWTAKYWMKWHDSCRINLTVQYEWHMNQRGVCSKANH